MRDEGRRATGFRRAPGRLRIALCLAPVLSALGAASALAATDDLRLISRAAGADGVKANGTSAAAVVSATGGFVTFSSGATNLVPDDTDGVSDVYVRSVASGAVTLASRASGAGGAKGNGTSGVSSISAEGRIVVFASGASNLAAEDGDAISDIFVRDLQANTTALVSRASGGGAKANADSFSPTVSADGRFVAFASNASNLHPDDGDTVTDVFVRDLQTGVTTLASRADGGAGAKGTAGAAAPKLSATGRFVVFSSNASNLSPDDPDAAPDVYVRDLATGATILASRSETGGPSDGDSFIPSISADGRFVAFGSSATNLSPADRDSVTDVYVRDIVANSTILVSRAGGPGGPKGNGFSDDPAVSADGRSVVFVSNATNVHPDDRDVVDDVFVRNIVTNETRLVSRASSLAKGAGFSVGPSIAGNGSAVTFVSNSPNLTPEDTDTTPDVFLRNVASAPPGPATGQPGPVTRRRAQPGCPQKGLQIIGTAKADRRTGTSFADVMFGLGGNDRLGSLAGADCLYGGAGNDRLFGGVGNDRLFGENGNDQLSGEKGNDRLTGGAGNDRLSGGAGNDRLTDTRGRDRVSGGAGKDRIDVRDTRRADRRKRDTVRCGAGRDTVYADRADKVARDCERVIRRR